MIHTNGFVTPVVRRTLVSAAIGLTIVALAQPADAGQRRARLSRDLSDRLAAGVESSTDVIVTGSSDQVLVLATRYGARVKKRLKTATVLEVTGAQLRDLSDDADLATLSGDLPVRMLSSVTSEAIGANQVWTGGFPA